MLCATMGKVAWEVIHLQATEVAEVEEPFAWGKVGSSTMPHKRNPMICELIVALTKIVRQDSAIALDTMVQEHERDMGAWQAEWEFIPRAFLLTGSALGHSLRVAQGLRVNRERMRSNLQRTGGLAFSEAVMLELGRFIGRQEAHDLIDEISMHVVETGGSFREALLAHPLVNTRLSAGQVDDLLRPELYLGAAPTCADRVLGANHARPRDGGKKQQEA